MKKMIIGILIVLSMTIYGYNARTNLENIYRELANYGLDRQSAINFIGLSKLQGNQVEYKKALLKEIDDHPDNYMAYDLLGDMYKKNKDTENAIKYFKISLLANRKGYYAMNQLGILYLNKKEVDTAEGYFAKLVEVHPDFPDGHMGYGAVHASKGEYMRSFNDISEAKNRYYRLDKTKYPQLYPLRKQRILECEDLLKKLKAGALTDYKKIISETGEDNTDTDVKK